MSQCSRCGTINRPTARFCSRCDAAVVQVAPAGPAAPLAVGAVVQGRYQVLQLLGQGGMGAVYQVLDIRLGGKPLAMKEMSDAAITDPQEKAAAIADPQEKAAAIAAFGQEAQLLARLDYRCGSKQT